MELYFQEIEAKTELIAEMRRHVDKETDKNAATDGSATFALESVLKVLKSRYTDLQKKFDELDKPNEQSSSVMVLYVVRGGQQSSSVMVLYGTICSSLWPTVSICHDTVWYCM